MDNPFFPSPPKPEEVNYFPEPGVDNLPLTNTFKEHLAERYSFRTGKSYDEVKVTMDNYGPESVTNTAVTREAKSLDQMLQEAHLESMDSETFLKNYEQEAATTKAIAEAGMSTDLVEDIYTNRDISMTPVTQKQLLWAALLKDEASKAVPEKGTLGTVFDFVGSVTRDVVVGPFERAGQSGKEEYMTAYLTAMSSGTLDEMRKAATAVVTTDAAKGIIGQNSFNIYSGVDAATKGGLNLGEQFGFAVDVATLLPVTKITKVGSFFKALPLSADAIDIAATRSVATADAALSHALSSEASTAILARQTAPIDSKINVPSVIAQISPSSRPVLQEEVTGRYANIIANTHGGRYVDPTLVDQAAKRQAAEVAKFGNSSYRGHQTIDMGMDNYSVDILLGKEDGNIFVSKAKAELTAKRVGGTVIPVDGENGFMVSVNRAVKLKGLSIATDPNTLRTGVVRDAIGSPEVTSNLDLLTLRKQGEARGSYLMKEVGKSYNKARSKLGKFNGEKNNMDFIVRELQESGRVDGYSVEEFADVWHAKTGVKPRPEVIKAYEAYDQLNYAKWYMDADVLFKNATERGVRVVRFKGSKEFKVISEESKNLGKERMVYDFTTGKSITVGEAQSKNSVVYSVVEEADINGVRQRLVTGSVDSNRSLVHHDVLRYNPGGVRDTDAKYFLRQDKKVMTSDGVEEASTPRLIFAGRSELEVKTAMNQIKDIMDKIAKATGVQTSALATTFADRKALQTALKTSSVDLNAYIAEKVTFNESIETVDDFLKMMDETGMDWGDLTVAKESDRLGYNVKDNSLIYSETSHGSLYRSQHNTYGDRYKTYHPPGMNDFHVDPTLSTERDFARGVRHFEQRAYIKNATEGLIKAVKAAGGKVGNENMPMLQRIKSLDIDTSNVVGRKLAQEQKNILNYMNEKSGFALAWERGMMNAQEYIFDKGYGQWSVFDYLSPDPIIALRGMAFQLKMGFFNIDQLVLQSSQALNIIAIAPKYGLQAAAATLPMRAAMTNEAVLKVVAERFAKTSGMTPEQFMDMMNYWKKSGRGVVGKEIIEVNGAEGLSYGIVKKALRAGTVFFNEGELVPRMMANYVAYREFAEKFPNVLSTTKEGFASMDKYIMSRSSALTANMTGASAASWQRGLASIPTQWTSYLARNMEQIFLGRDLSKGEKIRLAASQLVFYGMTGVGAGWVVDKTLAKSDKTMDPDNYTLIKYGLLDYLIGEATGARTAIATRFSLGESILDIWKNISDKNYVEVISGPSGKIAYDVVDQAFNVIGSYAMGRNNIAAYDATKFLKNISGFSRPIQAFMIMNQGDFVSKTGQVVASGLSPEAGVLYGLGVPLQEVIATYNIPDIIATEKEAIMVAGKRFSELSREAFRLYEIGDVANSDSLHAQALDLLTGFNVRQRREIMQFAKPQIGAGIDQTMQRLQKVGMPTLAQQLNKMKEGAE